MKTALLVLTVLLNLGLSTGNAQAQSLTTPQAFDCGAPNRFTGFHGTLDARGWAVGSGYADMKDASLHDGYLSANLLCFIKEVGSWGCVGYAFNSPYTSQILEVTVTKDPTTHIVTVSHTGIQAKSWTCQQ